MPESPVADPPIVEPAAPDPPVADPLGNGETTNTQFRGPLRYLISTSSPQLESGTAFTVYVKVTNPYDVPAQIKEIRSRLPVEFKVSSLSDSEDESSVIRETQVYRSKYPILSGPSSVQDIRANSLEEGLEEIGILQPGNSTVRVFTIKAIKPLFFTPSSYNLDFLCVYEMDGQDNSDVLEHQLNVRAPLRSVISGAMLGSIAGYTLRRIYPAGSENPSWIFPPKFGSVIDFLIHLFGSVIIAAVVVVAFARKKDSQPILTIEDFWGGFFVGVWAGFNGPSILDQYIKNKPA